MKSDSTRGRPKTVGRPDAAGGRGVFAVLEQLVGPLERSLPGSAEVVLHDLAALPDSIIAIEGDITGRRPGDPATDRLLEAAAGGDLRTRIGYRTTSPTGRSLLSTTIIIRDADDRPGQLPPLADREHTGAQAHGQGYDAKNLMHTIRLLETARDLARDGELRVRRANRDELLAIKRGESSYEELLEKAERLMAEVETAFDASDLPETVNAASVLAALVSVRETLYG